MTIYHCTGACAGISPVQKHCGAETCSQYNHPLTAFEQCEHCRKEQEQDGTPHWCENCALA